LSCGARIIFGFRIIVSAPTAGGPREKAAWARSRARTRSVFKERIVFVCLWRPLAVFGRDLSIGEFAGRKDRKETPRYPAFARSHTSDHTHPGLDTVWDCVRRLVYMYAYIYVHITLTISYTINLDFAATSIKTSLPPSHPQLYPFRANSLKYPAW